MRPLSRVGYALALLPLSLKLENLKAHIYSSLRTVAICSHNLCLYSMLKFFLLLILDFAEYHTSTQ